MNNNNNKIKRKVRNSYIVSTISVAMVLFLLSSVSYLILNAMSATNLIKESVAVYIMLNDTSSAEEKLELRERLMKIEGIKEAVFVSKDEAAKEFKEYVGDDFEDFLDSNPLPDSYELSVVAESTSSEGLDKIEHEVSKWSEVAEVIYQKNVINQITENINKFNLVMVTFGGMLLFISLILLNNTIRATIFAKRNIISTMKLVGATRWFILRPFLWSSIKQGFVAATIATAMFVGIIAGIQEGLPDIQFLKDDFMLVIIIGGIYTLGLFISLIFTLGAVNKYIKMHTNDIQLY